MFAFAAFGNFVGSAILGWSFQLLGSYGPAFLLFELLLLSAIVIFASLGSYVYPAPHAEPMRATDLTPAGAP
jgi:hypothetical protein